MSRANPAQVVRQLYRKLCGGQHLARLPGELAAERLHFAIEDRIVEHPVH